MIKIEIDPLLKNIILWIAQDILCSFFFAKVTSVGGLFHKEKEKGSSTKFAEKSLLNDA